MKSALCLLALCTLAGISLHSPAAPANPVVVRIDTGTLQGTSAGGVLSWKGIPFAAPPVGELRWRAPQPAPAWQGVRAASNYGNDCMQVPFPSDAAPLGTLPAEDCLYANVWRPAGKHRRLPVIFWLYGGGFVNGGASPPTYSGAELAKQGVLFVSANYRLAPRHVHGTLPRTHDRQVPCPASRVSRLASRVSRLASRVSRLTSHVSRLASRVSRLTSRVSRLTSHVSRLTSHVSRLTSHVSRLASAPRTPG